SGLGRSTLLTALHASLRGVLLGMKDFFHALQSQHPAALEETFDKIILEALLTHDHVFVDDAHLLLAVVGGGCHFYQRNGLINAPLTTIAAAADAAGKKLIFGLNGTVPEPLRQRGHEVRIADFEPADYAFLFQRLAPESRTVNPDFRKLHRFSRELTGHHF